MGDEFFDPAYTAEVFPTGMPGTASGLAVGSSQLGGSLGPPLVAGLLSMSPGFALPALAVAAPIVLSAVAMMRRGMCATGARRRSASLCRCPAGAPLKGD